MIVWNSYKLEVWHWAVAIVSNYDFCTTCTLNLKNYVFAIMILWFQKQISFLL